MMKNTISTLIDADTIIFLIAYNNRDNDDVDVVLEETDKFVELILSNTHCTHYLGFIGGENNFRYDVAKHLPYKGSRPDKPDWFTKWEPYIKMRLVDKWKFIITNGIEAEDGVSLANEYYKSSTNIVIAHVDKDLNDIEGNHYNYSKHKFYYVDKLGSLELNSKKKLSGTGRKWFWAQMIIGDPTDNIQGLKGKGAVFAYKLLDNCRTEYSMFRRTYTAYVEMFSKQNRREYSKILFKETLQLVGMLTKPEEGEKYGFSIPDLVSREQPLNDDELESLFS